jgi:hypothetical protein
MTSAAGFAGQTQDDHAAAGSYAEVMTTDMARRQAQSAVSRETNEPGEPGWWRRLWCRLMPPPDADLIADQLNRQLSVLEGARAGLEAGWVQGGWWTVSSREGSPRLVNGYAAAGGTPAHVDGACLVGALVRAGGPDAGRAVDAVYDALWASRGQPDLPGPRPVPSPDVRLARVRTLTHWNDQAERTQADVLALVDQAISATIMDLMSAPGSARTEPARAPCP